MNEICYNKDTSTYNLEFYSQYRFVICYMKSWVRNQSLQTFELWENFMKDHYKLQFNFWASNLC